MHSMGNRTKKSPANWTSDMTRFDVGGNQSTSVCKKMMPRFYQSRTTSRAFVAAPSAIYFLNIYVNTLKKFVPTEVHGRPPPVHNTSQISRSRPTKSRAWNQLCFDVGNSCNPVVVVEEVLKAGFCSSNEQRSDEFDARMAATALARGSANQSSKLHPQIRRPASVLRY